MSEYALPPLLVIEAHSDLGEQLSRAFIHHTVIIAKHSHEAITKLRRFEPGVVVFECGNAADASLEILHEMLSLAPDLKVIMIADRIDRKIAMQAINLGAYDCYVKPIDPPALDLLIQRAFYLHMLEKERKHNIPVTMTQPLKGIVTASPLMYDVCKTVQKVAPNNITILLLGESGTGKEVLAKALHEGSDRKAHSFVAINCAAIPENLLESELFGYERGAFTGAAKQTMGKIEMAHKGTLFLDEIGDLPLSLQPKLLRFLQERVIERVGGRTLIPVDVRVICATHHNLHESIKRQCFREDLYYRLSEVSITIPPLRDRIGDAALMARYFLSKFSMEFKKRVKRFSEEALEAIHQYSWPGNVRELENKIKRAVIMAEDQQITLADLDLRLQKIQPFPFNLKQVRDNAEKEIIARAINYCEGNVSKAAELLGITRPTLYNLMEKLHVNEAIYAQEH
jgi:two-component system NtrC family response regulator